MKTLGISFGGSGAEAIAGIAYIRALEEMDIKPVAVSGAGIGAIVASMYAAGMTSAAMVDFLKEIDFPGAKRPVNVAKIKDAKQGILDGMGLEEYYRMVVPIKVFDRLYFTLKVVAANFATGEETVFSEGDVGAAVRAAAAVPGILSPGEVDSMLFIDGSCVNPAPFDVIRGDCDVLVSIDPAVNQETSTQGGVLTVYSALMGAYNAAKRSLTAARQNTCKVEINERFIVEDITTYDFSRYDEIISSAEMRLEPFKSTLKELLEVD